MKGCGHFKSKKNYIQKKTKWIPVTSDGMFNSNDVKWTVCERKGTIEATEANPQPCKQSGTWAFCQVMTNILQWESVKRHKHSFVYIYSVSVCVFPSTGGCIWAGLLQEGHRDKTCQSNCQLILLWWPLKKEENKQKEIEWMSEINMLWGKYQPQVFIIYFLYIFFDTWSASSH